MLTLSWFSLTPTLLVYCTEAFPQMHSFSSDIIISELCIFTTVSVHYGLVPLSVFVWSLSITLFGIFSYLFWVSASSQALLSRDHLSTEFYFSSIAGDPSLPVPGEHHLCLLLLWESWWRIPKQLFLWPAIHPETLADWSSCYTGKNPGGKRSLCCSLWQRCLQWRGVELHSGGTVAVVVVIIMMIIIIIITVVAEAVAGAQN